MIILTTSTDEQTLKVISREYPLEVLVTLRDDSTNEVITYDVQSTLWEENDTLWNLAEIDWEYDSAYEENGYYYITLNFNLTENRYYDLTLKDANTLELIYRDKIFCTDQTVSDYSVNDGVYTTEDSYDNDYIII
jgi:hypothetical protein